MSADRATDVPVLVFDGDCGFCTSAMHWLARRAEFRPVPYQWADLPALGITPAEAEARVWVVEPDRRLGAAAAVATLLARSPRRGWRAAGRIMALPVVRTLAELGYRLVARFRHRLPGGTPACAAPR